MSERVLIAPWGNPFSWWEATYRVNCGEFGIKDCRDTVKEDSKSTLPALIEALNPEKVIIFALDTLVNARKDEENPPIPDSTPRTYDEVREDVEKRVGWFAEEIGIGDKVEIIVAPGVGEFKNASVLGNMLDFYSFTLKELSERLPAGDAEVFLDLTHGMNFMPVLTYRALKNLLGLSAYANNVRFIVVNSEPAIEEKGTMNIRVIENSPVRPKPVYSLIKGGEQEKRWSAFLSAVANGFPLAFATFYPKLSDIEKRIEEQLKDFISSIEVAMNGKIVLVKRKKTLDENFRTISKLRYLLRVLNQNGWDKCTGTVVPLKSVEAITCGLFARMPTIGPVVERQVETIRNSLSGIKLKKPTPMKELMRSSWGRKVHLRNFIAHSGFEGNLVMVNYSARENDYILYYDDERKVMNLCVRALEYRGYEEIPKGC